jgi:hypothetical protein
LLQAQQNKIEAETKVPIFYTDVPKHPYDIILAKPTNQSISINILTYENLKGYIQYGMNADDLKTSTTAVNLINGQPTAIEINQLQSDKKYYYRFLYKEENNNQYTASARFSFHTQRASKKVSVLPYRQIHI